MKREVVRRRSTDQKSARVKIMGGAIVLKGAYVSIPQGDALLSH